MIDSVSESTLTSSVATTYDRPVSALEDPANYNIRHPLQSKWTLWYRASAKSSSGSGSSGNKGSAKADNWEASLQCVNTVDTIEDFWGMYNNVPGIAKMDDNSDYMFFKEGIRPAWEDPANANGGSFTLQMKGLATGEFLWLNTVRKLWERVNCLIISFSCNITSLFCSISHISLFFPPPLISLYYSS